MTQEQIKLAANSVSGIIEASGCSINDILEVLAGNVFSDEECSEIEDYLESL